MSTPKVITAEQKRTIWGLAKKALHIDDETLYAMICETFGCERMSAMTFVQADVFIKELRRHAAKLGPDRLTETQYRKIKLSANELKWTREGLAKYVKNQTGIDNLAWLTVAQARVVIAGIEKIKKWHGNKVA